MIKPGTILPCTEISDGGYKVVAVIGWAEDFTVYQHYHYSTDEEIARIGDKLSSEQGRRLFPELRDYLYRS